MIGCILLKFSNFIQCIKLYFLVYRSTCYSILCKLDVKNVVCEVDFVDFNYFVSMVIIVIYLL